MIKHKWGKSWREPDGQTSLHVVTRSDCLKCGIRRRRVVWRTSTSRKGKWQHRSIVEYASPYSLRFDEKRPDCTDQSGIAKAEPRRKSTLKDVKRAKEAFDKIREQNAAAGIEVCMVVVGYVSGKEPFKLLGRVAADMAEDKMPDPPLSMSEMQPVAHAAKMALARVLMQRRVNARANECSGHADGHDFQYDEEYAQKKGIPLEDTELTCVYCGEEFDG